MLLIFESIVMTVVCVALVSGVVSHFAAALGTHSIKESKLRISLQFHARLAGFAVAFNVGWVSICAYFVWDWASVSVCSVLAGILLVAAIAGVVAFSFARIAALVADVE